jgi:hypothetical protein
VDSPEVDSPPGTKFVARMWERHGRQGMRSSVVYEIGGRLCACKGGVCLRVRIWRLILNPEFYTYKDWELETDWRRTANLGMATLATPTGHTALILTAFDPWPS